MKYISMVSIILSLNSAFAGIVFQQLTIEEALVLAKETNKKVFVDFYSTQCAPCKYMEQHVFTDNRFDDLMDTDYIAVRSNAGNIIGKMEKAKYKINMYPTVLILDHNDKELARVSGKKEVEELLTILTQVDLGTNKSNLEQNYSHIIRPSRPSEVFQRSSTQGNGFDAAARVKSGGIMMRTVFFVEGCKNSILCA
jgi:thioredoxin-related protein